MTSTLTIRGLAPVRDVMSNGAVVTVKESTVNPSVTISAAFQAGSGYDPPSQPGLAQFLSRVIDRGTSTRSADDIAEELDSRGVTLNISVTRHVLTVACTCLAEDFEPLLQLIGDFARTPTLPDEEIAKRRGEIVTAIRQDEDNTAVRATESLMEMLYGETHPYGRLAKGSIDSVEAIRRDDLVAFHRARFSPAGLSLVIVGDIDTAHATAAALRTFGEWGGTPTPSLSVPPPPRVESRRRRIISMMNKVQADIAYGFTTIARKDPAYYAYSTMNNILGQYGLGGRLGDNIRERQGMAYYAFSSFDANIGPGPLVIRAGVNPANVDRTLSAIDEEVARMAEEGPTETEVSDARQYLIGSIPRMLETNAAIASFLQFAEQFDLGLDYDQRLPDLFGSVTREEVHAAAREAISVERATLVVAGPYDGSTR